MNMQYIIAITSAIHVLTSVFWAGSTFTLARTGGTGERLFGAQMVAAALVILTGGYLFKTLHEGASGPVEHMLGIGVISALFAFAVQVLIVGRSLRKLRANSSDAPAQSRIVIANRVSGVLLAVAALSMGGSRFA
jgi:hypothetical protein